MAGDWIKLRSNIKDDPDVLLMAGNLNLDEFAIVGRLHAVWAWLDQHSSSGTNVRIPSAYLDRLTACPGFADAMRAVDWLRGQDGDLEFPNFNRHNGESAKRRATETKRKRVQRDTCPNTHGTSVPGKAGPEKRREENKEERERVREAEWIEQARQVVDAYPRREKIAEALTITLRALRDGESYEEMLAGTRAAAAVIRSLPSAEKNRYVPGAETFFRNQRWKDDPATLKRQGNPANGNGPMSLEEAAKSLGRRAHSTPESP